MTVNVRLADKTDTAFITDLWKQCFGDSGDFVKSFLGRASVYSVIGEYGGKRAGALHIVKASAAAKNALYCYAAGVLSELLFLKPADAGLEKYYRSLGMENRFCTDKTVCRKVSDKKAGVFDVTSDEYIKKRGKYLAAIPHIEWNNGYLAFALEDMKRGGVRTVRIESDSAHIYALISNNGDSVKLHEALADKATLEVLLPELLAGVGCVSAEALFPGENREMTAMAYGASPDGYCNIMLE